MEDPHVLGGFAVFIATALAWWFYGRETLPARPSIPLKDRKPIYYEPGSDHGGKK